MQRSTIAITALLLTLAFPASAADIRVFTGRGHPVRGVPSDALVTELDASTRLEEDLGADLPADADQAAALVQRRLEKG
ncbi:TPA: DUF1525 domain-containing protein, partial [Pseudomonas aeruginosa]|nr:DUF1525 domain-containing protein [Pseudomonas aeruginosa]